MATRIFFLDNEILIDTIPTPFVAGSLIARMNGNDVQIGRVESDFVFTSIPWEGVAARDGSTFDSPDDAMAYVTSQLSMRRAVGSPQRNYAVPAVDGQTLIPISPAPVDVNTLNLVINGALYAPPDIAVSADAVTWQGPFDLAASDAVRVVYF